MVFPKRSEPQFSLCGTDRSEAIADVSGALCLPAGEKQGLLGSWSVLHKDSGFQAAELSAFTPDPNSVRL